MAKFKLSDIVCLSSNRAIPMTINLIVTSELLTNDLKKQGVNIDDYKCQWFVKGNILKTEYFKDHQLELYKDDEPMLYVV